MTLDELTRTLHEQADEAIASSPDFLRSLPSRRRRDRRRLLVVAAAPVAIALVAVLALIARPGASGGSPDRPVGPATSPSVSPSSAEVTAGWRSVPCQHSDVESLCAPPAILRYAGQGWQSTHGGRQPVHNPSGTDLQLALSPAGSRLIVVGALQGGPQSELTVRIGDGPWLRLPDSGLTAVPLPAHAGDIMVEERGRPGPREVLAIDTYVPLR